jgi:hypothetical protein
MRGSGELRGLSGLEARLEAAEVAHDPLAALASRSATPAMSRMRLTNAERAARRWLVRYLSEGTPSLRDVAKVTASLAEHGGCPGEP